MREALKLALEALVEMTPSGPNGSAIWHKQMSAITAASEALAQPEQEPVGEVLDDEIDWFSFVPSAGSLIYTTPPQRKPLTEEQIINEADRFDWDKDCAVRFAQAIEAAHGIKE